MHETKEPAYTQAHRNFSAIIMGANSNSYLQRGGIFDVMSNRTGGIVSSGGLGGSLVAMANMSAQASTACQRLATDLDS